MVVHLLAARISFCTLIALSSVSGFASLADDFKQPQPAARPWTFWFWMNGNISREGITADLEAMHRVGIGGVLIMEVARPGSMAPDGPVKFASPEWNDLFKHVLSEADRLGLQVNMNNDAGWCGSGGPWVTPEQSMKKVVCTSSTITGPLKVDTLLAQPETVKGFYEDLGVFAVPASTQANSTSTSPINITDKINAEGRVTWDAPAGKWHLARVGYTSTGHTNKPAPKSGEGLEVDKFDPQALRFHFNSFIKKLTDTSKGLVGKTFVSTHIDSWEVGIQTWTADFPAEFQKRRGYDIRPFLPVVAGIDLQTSSIQERFKRDFTLTCSELNDEYYAGALRKVANENGLKLSIEAYGQAKFLNPLTYGAEADIPVSEFWISRWDAWHLLSPRLMASVAHVFGRPIMAAESFTSMPDKDPFTEHPYSVKTTGDWAMTEGVNRIIFHRTVHDPWTNLVPGMSFAGFGWHMDRNQTWFEQSAPFMKYLARCQTVLQAGSFVADVCRVLPDGEVRGDRPGSGPYPGEVEPIPNDRPGMESIPGQFEPIPQGYNYDYISDKALISEMTVENGQMVTRGGMRYQVLQLPQYTTMSLELARKVAELASAGATIVGPKPLSTPGLTEYPKADEQLKALAQTAWSASDNSNIVHQKPIAQVLADKGLVPDFQYKIDPPAENASIKSITGRSVVRPGKPVPLEMPTKGLNWIHRQLPEGDFYFIANPQYRAVEAVCSFRIKDTAPQLWYPDSGEIRKPAIYQASSNVLLPISFGPAESVFVFFPANSVPGRYVVDVQKDGQPLVNFEKPGKLPGIYVQDDRLSFETAIPGKYTMKLDDGTFVILDTATSGTYKKRLDDGSVAVMDVGDLPSPISIEGPWTVQFPPDRGAPASAEFPRLTDWSHHELPGIKYFSGTATYNATFKADAPDLGVRKWNLNLGDVQVMAEVILNGKNLGILWKQPYSVDVTSALKPGKNELEVKVTNLWPNRMIGDEQFPDDCTPDGSWTKGPLKAWPAWIINNTPRPDPRRITFTTFKYYQKDSPLMPSGLLGPVKVQPVYVKDINIPSH